MRKQSFLFVLALAGLVNGCGGGQTKPGDPNSQDGKTRCRPDMRCSPVEDEDPPPKTSQNVVIPD